MSKSHSVILALAASALPAIVAAQSSSLLDERAAGLIRRELSGVEAKRYVVRLTAWDRISASPGFHDAAVWLLGQLKGLGITDAELERYAAEQPARYRKGAPSPLPRWLVRTAELRVVEPFEHLVASYEQLPITLARYSRPASVTAELVDVGRGTSPDHYDGLDVRDKLVLATGFSSTVENLAVGRYGAVGVVVSGGESYNVHKGWGYPHMVTWQVLAPRPVDGREPTFAFSISAAEGERLRRELRAGQRLLASVLIDAELAAGAQEVVTAVIPGTSRGEEEILLLSHIDHVRPSANDNASGSGLLLEIARTLHRLIDAGLIEPPARTIRFLWMTEGAGTYAFFDAHPDLADRVIAAINLDMVGEGPHPGNGPFNIRRPPDSMPSYFLDVVTNLTRWLDGVPLRVPTGSDSVMNVRVKPWSPDSDHYILNDGALAIPTVFLHSGPDPFHHTNLDAPDKVDPTNLERAGIVAAGAAYLLATASEAEARRIAWEVLAEGGGRLAEAAREGLALLGSVRGDQLTEAYWLAERKLVHYGARERSTLRAVGELANGLDAHLEDLSAAVDRQLEALGGALAQAYETLAGKPPGERPLDADERAAAGLVPRRARRLLNERWRDELLQGRVEETDREWLEDLGRRLPYSYIRIPELLNFMDGKRSLLDIRDALSAEAFDFGLDAQGVGRVEDFSLDSRRIPMSDLLRLVQILERYGLVALERRL